MLNKAPEEIRQILSRHINDGYEGADLDECESQILAYVDKRERLAHDTGFIAGKDATLDGLALTNSKVTEGE